MPPPFLLWYLPVIFSIARAFSRTFSTPLPSFLVVMVWLERRRRMYVVKKHYYVQDRSFFNGSWVLTGLRRRRQQFAVSWPIYVTCKFCNAYASKVFCCTCRCTDWWLIEAHYIYIHESKETSILQCFCVHSYTIFVDDVDNANVVDIVVMQVRRKRRLRTFIGGPCDARSSREDAHSSGYAEHEDCCTPSSLDTYDARGM